jgi:hypothetical protein
MSTDRDTTRIVRLWLRTDENDSADRVLGNVLDRLDTTPQRRAPGWPARRLSDMNMTLKAGVAAAVVAVAILVGIDYVGSSNVGGPRPAESATPSLPEPTPTPVTVPSATITADSAVVDAFVRPFRLLLRAESGLAVTDASRSIFAVTHGSAETYPGFGYEDVSEVWGLTATWGSPARTHEDSGSDTEVYGELRTEAFFEDLRRNPALSFGVPRTAALGGLPALAADIRFRADDSGTWAYPDIHMDDDVLVALAFPGKLIVADVGGANFVVHIWASSEEELTAWLPMANQIAASIRFIGE